LGSDPPDAAVPSPFGELSQATVEAKRPASRTERLMMAAIFPQPEKLIIPSRIGASIIDSGAFLATTFLVLGACVRYVGP
jgi:hypothetical protein